MYYIIFNDVVTVTAVTTSNDTSITILELIWKYVKFWKVKMWKCDVVLEILDDMWWKLWQRFMHEPFPILQILPTFKSILSKALFYLFPRLWIDFIKPPKFYILQDPVPNYLLCEQRRKQYRRRRAIALAHLKTSRCGKTSWPCGRFPYLSPCTGEYFVTVVDMLLLSVRLSVIAVTFCSLHIIATSTCISSRFTDRLSGKGSISNHICLAMKVLVERRFSWYLGQVQ